MSWAWKIGTVRGIALYVHATFLLALAWIVVLPVLAGHDVADAIESGGLVLLLFGCIVLHELGHALSAQRYGIRTRGITLYPMGGVARLERIPRDPGQELRIALAGPAVNLAIALVLLVFSAGTYAWVGGPGVLSFDGSLINKLMWSNLVLAGFNLLPAFPMDGGRVLRAMLASRMEYGRATQVAATVGEGMSFLFGFAGLVYNPFLILIAFFVYVGAAEEAAMVAEERAFHGVPASAAMMTQFETLSPADPLSHAMERLLAGAQSDFPVVETGTLVGLLTRSALMETLREHGPSAPVSQAMSVDPASIPLLGSMEAVFDQMRDSEMQSLPVLENGRVVGLITLENIAEHLMLQQAIQRHDRVDRTRSARQPARTPGG